MVKVAHIFYDFKNRKVVWYEMDEKNLLKQHHEHEEYKDIKGIENCLKSPDQINKPKSEKSKDKRKLIYYKERGGNLLYSKWHKVVIRVCRNWDEENVSNSKKKAVLIIPYYVEENNPFNEEKIWP